jgi:hypothetical protein
MPADGVGEVAVSGGIAGCGDTAAGAGLVVIFARIKRDDGMTLTRTGEIGGDGEKPRREFRRRLIAMAALIDSDESLLRRVKSVFLVADVTQDESHKRGLPGVHQLGERQVLACFEVKHDLRISIRFRLCWHLEMFGA